MYAKLSKVTITTAKKTLHNDLSLLFTTLKVQLICTLLGCTLEPLQSQKTLKLFQHIFLVKSYFLKQPGNFYLSKIDLALLYSVINTLKYVNKEIPGSEECLNILLSRVTRTRDSQILIFTRVSIFLTLEKSTTCPSSSTLTFCAQQFISICTDVGNLLNGEFNLQTLPPIPKDFFLSFSTHPLPKLPKLLSY